MNRRKRTSLAERFWRNVDKTSDPSGCWIWTAGKTRGGYGQIRMEPQPGEYRGRKIRTHRLAYKFCVGQIPPGLSVCHRCDNPSCVNPEHLWLGTHAENLKDMSAKKRSPRGERSGSAKLKHQQVDVIRLLLSGKTITQRQLALLVGVSPSTITHIRHGITWEDDNA